MAGLGEPKKRYIKKGTSPVAKLAGKAPAGDTDPEVKNSKSTKPQKVEAPKAKKVDKHYQLDPEVYERFRLYCFEQRAKETPCVNMALDAWLKDQGY